MDIQEKDHLNPNKNHLKLILASSLDKRVEEAVTSRLAEAEDEIVARVLQRLGRGNLNCAKGTQTRAGHKFFDPLAGP